MLVEDQSSKILATNTIAKKVDAADSPKATVLGKRRASLIIRNETPIAGRTLQTGSHQV